MSDTQNSSVANAAGDPVYLNPAGQTQINDAFHDYFTNVEKIPSKGVASNFYGLLIMGNAVNVEPVPIPNFNPCGKYQLKNLCEHFSTAGSSQRFGIEIYIYKNIVQVMSIKGTASNPIRDIMFRLEVK